MADVPAPVPSAGLRGIVACCLERDTLIHSARTALLVGTVLALINHGADMLAGQLSARWVVPMLITYLVPFSVATYGQVHGKRQRDALRERPTPAGSRSPPTLHASRARRRP